MVSIIEFALIAWVSISVVAVLVQLIRIGRYQRAIAASPSVPEQASKPASATIDLEERLAPTKPPVTAGSEDQPSQVMAGAATAERHAPRGTTPPTAPPSAPKVTLPTARPVVAPAPTAPPATPPVAAPMTPPTAVPEAAPVAAEVTAPVESAPAAPTLADLLAGVRLPWNLLPTVDQSREPSNDRVVLITSEGEPSEIGVDVADELERLGFTIAPRGDDTALATRDGQSLGLRIIEEPMTAEVDGTRRFPTATETSVALDIWVEANEPA